MPVSPWSEEMYAAGCDDELLYGRQQQRPDLSNPSQDFKMNNRAYAMDSSSIIEQQRKIMERKSFLYPPGMVASGIPHLNFESSILQFQLKHLVEQQLGFSKEVMDRKNKNRKKERAREGVSSDAESNERQTSPTDRNLFHAGLNNGGHVQDRKQAQRIIDAYWKHAALQKLLFPQGTLGYFHGENVSRSPQETMASPSRDMVSPSRSVRSPQEAMASPSRNVRSPLEGMAASPPISLRKAMAEMKKSSGHRLSPRHLRSPVENMRPRNVRSPAVNDAKPPRDEILERYGEDMERERVSPAYEQERGSPANEQERGSPACEQERGSPTYEQESLRVSPAYARNERFTNAYDGTLAAAKNTTASWNEARVQEMFGMRREDQRELPSEIEKRRVDESTRAVMPAEMQFSGFQSNQNMLEGSALMPLIQKFSWPADNNPFSLVNLNMNSGAVAFNESQVLSSLQRNSMKKKSRCDIAADTLSREVTKYDGRSVYSCHICPFVGLSEDEFKEHMNNHYKSTCSICGYRARTEGRLKRHLIDAHADSAEKGEIDGAVVKAEKKPKKVMKRTCRLCKFITFEQNEYWRHMRIHLKPEKLLECDQTGCEFVTDLKHHLEYHLRAHAGSKPHKCNLCNYTCINKSMLNSHKKSHTNVYQYRCRTCQYATKYSHSLKMHLRHKENHKADIVLNADGSLPKDGSGDFDLISRRGPPRGPRGPRKTRGHALMPEVSEQLSNSQNDSLWGASTPSRPSSVASFVSRGDHVEGGLLGQPAVFPFNYLPPLLNLYPESECICSFCPARFKSVLELNIHAERYHADQLSKGGHAQPSPDQPSSNCLPSLISGLAIHSKASYEEYQQEGEDDSGNGSIPLDLSSSNRNNARDDDSGHMTPASMYSLNENSPQLPKKRSRKGVARHFVSEPELARVKVEASEENVREDSFGIGMEDSYGQAGMEDSYGGGNVEDEGLQNYDSDNGLEYSKPVDPNWKQTMVDRQYIVCRHCEIAFKDELMFQLHTGYHSRQNPFQCNSCGKQCIDAMSFVLHLLRDAHASDEMC